MTSDRARGAVLYGTAAALLAGGGVWWALAAPAEDAGDPTDRWRADAERLLPDAANHEDADTVVLPSGAEEELSSQVPCGSYVVGVICVGGPGSTARVALSRDGSDSGLGLSCEGEHPPDTFPVGLAGDLRLHVTVSDGAGPVVFRYTVARRPT